MASLRCVILAAVLANVMAAPSVNTGQNSLRERMLAADAACQNVPSGPQGTCAELCRLKHIGTVAEDGRYIESGGADLLRVSLGPAGSQVDQAPIRRAAKACNTVNDHIVEGCDRAYQVGACLTTAYDKIVCAARRATKAAAAETACSGIHEASCRKSCILKSFGVVDDERGIIDLSAMDLVAVTFPDLNLYKMEELVHSCIRADYTMADDCDGRAQFYNCLESRYPKVKSNTI